MYNTSQLYLPHKDIYLSRKLEQYCVYFLVIMYKENMILMVHIPIQYSKLLESCRDVTCYPILLFIWQFFKSDGLRSRCNAVLCRTVSILFSYEIKFTCQWLYLKQANISFPLISFVTCYHQRNYQQRLQSHHNTSLPKRKLEKYL